MAADSEISLLTRGSSLSKVTCKTWSSQPDKEEDGDEEGEQLHVKFMPPEGGIPSPQLRSSENETSFTFEGPVETNSSDVTQTHIGFTLDTSQVSVRSTDTTLEFYDAPVSEDHEYKALEDDDDDVVTLNIKPLTEEDELEEKPEETAEQTLDLTLDDAEQEEDILKEDKFLEDLMEQEAQDEEEAESERKNEPDIESNLEDIASLDQEEPSAHLEGSSHLKFHSLIL